MLKTEVLLHKQEEVAKALESRNQRLTQEVSQLRLASSRAVKQFERRTTEGLCNEVILTNFIPNKYLM